ncbi:lipid-A-disaccharide synthase [Pacificibacter marinus]|uniref:Lipid-A-disaccharide synthase n=1 Tax=Pacificibacter marinus TaxID=658057 RepID=A0A1Y5TII2_9RHOB|nr:lipid-A-disaccharide synthase [Pacificibacter marinus]SEL25518.1 lipid-A-disaccharide synthase [Pacificibacter marinus]SLN64767.1 Lipid-A-disaccharide synthase [Pacificibacter marinus]
MNTDALNLKVFIIAGEQSGDKLGAAAMAGLKSLHNVDFRGVGGPLMAEQGLESLFPMDELSLMGIMEILPKYFHLKRRIRETAEAAIAWAPDVILTIDSPDFCLRVADIVKAQSDLRICHYVAPTVWAWRPERAAKMAAKVDQVLALFPFEPRYFEAKGLRCDFVGHPVSTEYVATDAEVAAFRAEFQINKAPLVLVLPGSRKGEVARLSDDFGAALGLFAKTHPDARYVLPMAGPVEALVREKIADWPVQPILIKSSDKYAKRAAFKAADIALAASGTVSLELAANQTPMVIAYKMQWLTQKIVERKLLIDTVTLVNLVSETRVVPEYLAQKCQPKEIAKALSNVLQNPDAQTAALDLTMQRLGQGGDAPGLRAARAILDGVRKAKP